MGAERIINAKRNMITALIFKMVAITFPFVIRIIILKKLGAEYAGLSSLFGAILNFLNLADLGVGSAIVFSMYSPIVRGENEKVCQLLNYIKKVYNITSITIAFSGLLILPFVTRIIRDDYPKDINVYLLFIIYLFNTAGSYAFGAYRQSLFSAHQREDIISKASIVINIVYYILQMIVLLFVGNYYCYAVLISLSNISTNVILAMYSKKMYPNIEPRGRITNNEKKQLYKGVTGLFINRISSAIRNSCDTVFVTTFCGLIMTTTYSNYYMILMAINGILILFGQSIRAGVGVGIVSNSIEKNHVDYMTLQIVYMFVSGFAVIGVFFLCPIVIEYAFGVNYVFSKIDTFFLALYLLTLKMVDINNVYIDASGIWWSTKYATMAEAIINLILDAVLGKLFGVSGIIIATIISLYLFSFIFKTIAVFKKVFNGISPARYLLFQHGVTLIVIITICGVDKIIQRVRMPFFEEIVAFLLASIIYFILFILLNSRNAYYANAKRIMTMVLRIGSNNQD